MITQEDKFKINMIFILEDIQDQYITELHPRMKQNMKYMIKDAANQTKKFIKFTDKVLNTNSQESFGDASDMLREFIEDKFKQIQEEMKHEK